MTVINTNVSALKARLASQIANRGVDTAALRLSSGRRLNFGADDAAGAAVFMKMNAQLMGQKAAIKTAADALSLLNVQEAAVQQFANIIQRIKELSVQMANGTYSDDDRSLAQLEADQLVSQFQKVAANTRFNELQVVNGTVDNSLSVLQTMNEQRAIIGASINRMLASINNLSSAAIKTEVAIGRIVDTDFALESAKLAKQQILSQSSNQMLSIANQSKEILAQLLQ